MSDGKPEIDKGGSLLRELAKEFRKLLVTNTAKMILVIIAAICILIFAFLKGLPSKIIQPFVDTAITKSDLVPHIPIGAVLAFDREICPTEEGWDEYKPAYGRFIRGIDKSSEYIDVSGQRKPGNLQEDMVGKHEHQAGTWAAIENGDDQSHENVGASGQVTTIMIPPHDETRPKNVALLFCKKIR